MRGSLLSENLHSALLELVEYFCFVLRLFQQQQSHRATIRNLETDNSIWQNGRL